MNSIIKYSEVGASLRRASFLALVLVCLIPAGAAATDMRGTVETSVLIEGSGEGELQHSSTRMDWYPRTLPDGEPVTILQGSRIVVTMRETTTSIVNPGGPKYTHAKSDDPRVVAEFSDARLELTTLGIRSRLILAENGICVSRTSAEVHFSIAPPKAIDSEAAVGNASAQSWERFFDRRADDLQLAQQRATARGQGDFSFYILNTTFAVQSSTGRQEFEASVREDVPSSPAARVTTERAYIVDVYDGSYDTSPIGGRTESRANHVQVMFRGSLTADEVEGTVSTVDGKLVLEDDRLELAGVIRSAIRSRVTEQGGLLRMDFEQEPVGASPQSGIVDLGPVSSGWTFPVAFGGVLALAGVAAITYRPLRARLQNPAQAAAPAAPAATQASSPADLTRIAEDAYRADPGNIQRAMELALHYANAERHGEALPLLLMTVRQFPKSDVARYATALALLHTQRVDEAIGHLEYAFRLNPLNVARFVKEGPAHAHGDKPQVAELLNRWARVYHESNSRGYA